MDSDAGTPSKHDSFRYDCMLYGDFNRPVFLEEILRFISSAITSKAELAAIRKAVLKRTKRIETSRRGRPRAWDDEAWIQKAITTAFRRHVLGWSWPKIATEAKIQPTKPNIRTLQRQELLFAELIFDSLPTNGCWETGAYGERLRETAFDTKATQRWISGQTGLPFEERPEECKKIVIALAPLGLQPSTDTFMRQVERLRRKRKD